MTSLWGNGGLGSGPPPLAVTPQYDSLMQQAQSQDTAQLQELASSDTASLMARYGTRLALARAATGPGAPAASPLLAKAA